MSRAEEEVADELYPMIKEEEDLGDDLEAMLEKELKELDTIKSPRFRMLD
jgi:hypothetical protein